jgi:hypothetical protein
MMCKIMTISNRDSAKWNILPSHAKLCLLCLSHLSVHGLIILLIIALCIGHVQHRGGDGVAQTQLVPIRHGRHYRYHGTRIPSVPSQVSKQGSG